VYTRHAVFKGHQPWRAPAKTVVLLNFWSDEMKKSMDKDAFGLTFAQFED
jgi:hypothetical protein